MPAKGARKGKGRGKGRIKVGNPPKAYRSNWSESIVGSGNRTVKAGKRVWELTEAVRGFRKLL